MIMRKINLLAGIAAALFGLFVSQTFAASDCELTACAPAAVAERAPAALAANPAEDCNSDCLSSSLCGTGSTCSSCGSPVCNGYCHPCGCAGIFEKLKKSLREDVRWSGYINAGYDTNFSGDRSNGIVDAWNNTTPTFNAILVSAVKKASTGGYGFDYGFRVDFMFGEDARIFRSARGLDQNWITGHMYNANIGKYNRPSYGFAMPHLYLETAINNWTVKLGHFRSLAGYEGAPAPGRFFYTKGLICSSSQTGVLATYNGFENFDITLGWVNGWNNGFDNSKYNDGMITGSFTYRMTPAASIKYSFLAGTADIATIFAYWGSSRWGHTKGVGSVHSGILDVHLNSRLESVTIINYTDFGQAVDSDSGTRALVLGEHLYYTINSCWKAGFRAEWLKQTDYYGTADDTEVTSFTLGLNWHPAGNQNLYVRPELRYDRTTGACSALPLNGRVDQLTIGFDVMLKF